MISAAEILGQRGGGSPQLHPLVEEGGQVARCHSQGLCHAEQHLLLHSLCPDQGDVLLPAFDIRKKNPASTPPGAERMNQIVTGVP